ncbi:hypothetical protein SD77_0386 [Bacillus badius]|uniref:Ribose 5-phosphate isomerase B n=1 Tax=Bacillus badius TaxID=1455 RepID=A0ABR5B220_BACBA|nr:hypothetical protein SD77_0386 [Bacillus badius]
MKGEKTSAGSPPPRKMKRLEWKSTAFIHKQTKKAGVQTSVFIEFVYGLKEEKRSLFLFVCIFSLIIVK